MDPGKNKRVVTNCSNKSQLQSLASTTDLKAQNIKYKNQQLPMLTGGHSIVKLNTACETSLLPLYYMA